MASNARFHNKYHRRNHHTLPSAGYPDSGADPIASPQEPFLGDFHAVGALSATGNLTIGGNTLIYGNLSALGEFSVVDTIVTVTSALSVINDGTGPAFTVRQKGAQPIAIFFDDNNKIFNLKDNLRAEFFNSQATNTYALAEGQATLAQGNASHSEGISTQAFGQGSHAEGAASTATGDYSHAEGDATQASGNASHSEGDTTQAIGNASHAEGSSTTASGDYSHAEGSGTTASGAQSHAEGIDTIADGPSSHAEGYETRASGIDSHAEGSGTEASGFVSHAQGAGTVASGSYSHAEGVETKARGDTSHAAGSYAEAAYDRSWIWKGSTVTDTTSTTRTDQFLVSAAGGVFFPGNVGIGTDSVANALTVNGSVSASNNLFFYSSTGRNLDLIHTPANDGTNPTMRIGESTPGSTTLSGFSGAFVSYDETTNVFGISSVFAPAMGVPAIAIVRNSNIGIGTNAPSRQLNVALPSGNTEIAITTDSSSVASLYFGNPSTGDNRGQIRYYNALDAMAISTATQEAVRIRGGGQVGIGVTTPAEALTVSGNISSNGTLFTQSVTSRGLDLIHTPFNDGVNPILRFGESDYGTGNNGFSGAFMSYNEITNTFGISSIFAPAMGIPAISIDRRSYVGIGTATPIQQLTVVGDISASGTITAGNVANTSYYLAIGPFCSAGVMGSGALQSQVGTASVYPRALSGVMPANELSSRLKNGQGTIEGTFLFEKTENVITAQWYIEIAKNEVFTNTLSAVYLRTVGDSTRSIFRPVIGTNIGNNSIVMPAYNSTSPYGGSGSNTINYPYTPGDTLYWRVGFNNPGTVGTSIGMALCAGYIRIVP